MFDINEITKDMRSRFDEFFCESKDKLVVSPLGGGTWVLLDNAEPIEAIYCLEDKSVDCSEQYGYPVKSREDVLKDDTDYKVIITSSLHYEKIRKEYIKQISKDRVLPYMNFDTRIHYNYSKEKYLSWLSGHERDLAFVYDRLGDQRSQEHFKMMLRGLENYSAAELLDLGVYAGTERPDYFHDLDFFPMSKEEVYLDVGAYDGDTLRDFLRATQGCFKSITAVEPDEELYEELLRECRKIQGDINCLKIGLGDKECKGFLGREIESNKYLNTSREDSMGNMEIRTIDSLEGEFSVIKISVLGLENRIKIIRGAKRTLETQRPKVAVQVGRYEDDIVRTPMEILKCYSNYKIYFRFMLWPQGDTFRINSLFWAV